MPYSLENPFLLVRFRFQDKWAHCRAGPLGLGTHTEPEGCLHRSQASHLSRRPSARQIGRGGRRRERQRSNYYSSHKREGSVSVTAMSRQSYRGDRQGNAFQGSSMTIVDQGKGYFIMNVSPSTAAEDSLNNGEGRRQ